MCGEQSRWPAKRGENGEAHGQSVAISYSTKGRKRQASVQELVQAKRPRRPGWREEDAKRGGASTPSDQVNSIQVKDTTFTKLCEHPSI
jgi:hypothetical protein